MVINCLRFPGGLKSQLSSETDQNLFGAAIKKLNR